MVKKQHDARRRLRQQLQTRRRALTPAQINNRSTHICKRLRPLIAHSSSVAGYLAVGAEVQINSVAQELLEDQVEYYLPVVLEHQQMKFAQWNEHTLMGSNRYGISEPLIDPQLLVSGMSLDTVLVPLVGFDNHLNRLGMGGGYYDRCFAQRQSQAAPPTLIGVAYECQCVSSVYPDSWDVPLDIIVTEDRVVMSTAS